MKHLVYYISEQMNPWKNLAVEEAFLHWVPQDTVVLYLWQNRRTVVVGRNQNCWAECNVSRLEHDGGYLARRLSGGGSVYHDEQNLNFTFLANHSDYDISGQTDVITRAVRMFGLEPEKTGRNDITISDRKFSGNAYYKKDGKCFHHGTLLIHTDMDAMKRYLNVSGEKLRGKGVPSVKARVLNLQDICKEITVKTMKQALLLAASEVYEATPQKIGLEIFEREYLADLEEKNSSWEWRYGRKIPFSWEREKRFEWGNIQMRLYVDQGIIRQAVIYSDALDAEFISKVELSMAGLRFEEQKLENVINLETSEEQKKMLADIDSMIMEGA